MSHFEPKSYRERAPLRAPDHPPMARLRRLGLTRQEETETYDRWFSMTDAEKFEALEAMENLDDEELRRQITEGREESARPVMVGERGPEHVTTEEADADAVDPEDVPDGTVAEVLDWVGDDRHRAAAALLAEQRRHDPPRKTLVEPLEDLVG